MKWLLKSKKYCLNLNNSTVKDKGLGDTIHRAIQSTTFNKLKPCGKCGKRRKRLNSVFPYGYGR